MDEVTDIEATGDAQAKAVLVWLMMLMGYSAALAVTGGIVRTPIGVPGHSAVFWVPVLVLAGAQKRPGLAAGSAILGGAMCFLYCGRGIREVTGLLAAGAAVEACGGLRQSLSLLGRMVIAGLLAHLGKLATKVAALLVAGVPLNLAGLALVKTIMLYSAFGIIAGGLAWLIAAGWDNMRTRLSSAEQSGDSGS